MYKFGFLVGAVEMRLVGLWMFMLETLKRWVSRFYFMELCIVFANRVSRVLA